VTDRATDVLIVGAGPVGLALAIDLGSRSIPCIVVEQHGRVGLNPRAKLTNVRARELLRRWGVADALRCASPLPPDYPSDVVFATRMNGYTLARFEDAFYCASARSDLYSEPGHTLWRRSCGNTPPVWLAWTSASIAAWTPSPRTATASPRWSKT
jgi:hypothetical protein